MEEICKKDECTGCGACYASCPKQCIEMKADAFGFLVPQINEAECIQCDRCRAACPQSKELLANDTKDVWAVWNNDAVQRATSASGGVACGFYSYALKNGYAVVGTDFDEDFVLKHGFAEKKEELVKFKGSKYVQSICFEVFDSIHQRLKRGEKILFIGTPCQVMGLKGFLKNDFDNLITVDIVCHGVPSLQYLQEHVQAVTHQEVKGKRVSFRGPDGWKLKVSHGSTLLYEKDAQKDVYFRGFLSSLFYRECCYRCRYATPKRVSDITIGDFWGIGKLNPVSYSTEKVSLVMVNSAKGQEFWSKTQDLFFSDRRNLSEAILDNEQLVKPSTPHKKRHLFLKLYEQLGFEKAAEKLMKNEIRQYEIDEFFAKVNYKFSKILRGRNKS